MIEPQWAALFGPDCMICGKENAGFTDYDLRLRGCGPCLQMSCVPYDDTWMRCVPKLRSCMMEIMYLRMVPRSRPTEKRNAWAPSISIPLYYAPPMEEVVRECFDLREKIKAGIPNAVVEFDAYVSKRRAIVRGIVEHADLCYDLEAKLT
ncbi:hypothetical protein FRB94_008742 [Tulasnella sp. JGI-2019a]|nr:hypothetical protein FRB94_008742 [Tulasnella sp. JGI-2019a]KAG9026857.1 hypothetical protein FRB95_008379 [Tulasnella sp. JGI-2019a]